MLHDLPDTASTLQSGTSEESEETWSGSKEERHERESSRKSFLKDAEMLSNDRATVTTAAREQQLLH
jgi:hypothetical protein